MEQSAAMIIGLWIAGFLTLCIFSFLYKDNPFYRFAEHLYVGVSAGYAMSVEFNSVLKGVLYENLAKAWHEIGLVLSRTADRALLSNPEFLVQISFLVPLFLGILMLARLSKKMNKASRYALAFLVGINAGFNIVFTMQAQVLEQIRSTIVPLWVAGSPLDTVLNWILALGVLSGLVYFYFSREHKGAVMRGLARFGILVLMVAFGAAYGNTVMGRISLLMGRLYSLQDCWATLPSLLPSLFK
jgi:hypothetical protein